MTVGVLFDLDGTLVDSLGDIASALNHVLADAGHPVHDDATVATMVGNGAAALVERAAPANADHTALLAALRVRYGAHAVATTRPFPGVVELLAALRDHGVGMAVLSNKPHAMTVDVVRALFADVPFAAVVGQRPDVPKKPDPSAALSLARQLGTTAAQCTMVGDTEVDVQTGRRAAMRSIAVTWGFRSRAELVAESPDAIADTVAELSALLLG